MWLAGDCISDCIKIKSHVPMWLAVLTQVGWLVCVCIPLMWELRISFFGVGKGCYLPKNML